MGDADDHAPKAETWESILHDRTIRTKQELRKRLAALSVTEKIKILEKLRDRELALAGAGLRRKPAGDSTDNSDKKEK